MNRITNLLSFILSRFSGISEDVIDSVAAIINN